jgi:hypothetical protein
MCLPVAPDASPRAKATTSSSVMVDGSTQALEEFVISIPTLTGLAAGGLFVQSPSQTCRQGGELSSSGVPRAPVLQAPAEAFQHVPRDAVYVRDAVKDVGVQRVDFA